VPRLLNCQGRRRSYARFARFARIGMIAKILEPLLFHTKVLEPLTVAGVVVFGAVIALAASFFPMKTVLRTDVMAVLREQ